MIDFDPKFLVGSWIIEDLPMVTCQLFDSSSVDCIIESLDRTDKLSMSRERKFQWMVWGNSFTLASTPPIVMFDQNNLQTKLKLEFERPSLLSNIDWSYEGIYN